jgi:bacterioferritin-associated ferredoxin
MIVCHCVGVSDAMIRKLIAAGASSVGEITRRCGAGRCCAPCREEIASLLDRSSTALPAGREFAPAECA